jgi:hypothetical protein
MSDTHWPWCEVETCRCDRKLEKSETEQSTEDGEVQGRCRKVWGLKEAEPNSFVSTNVALPTFQSRLSE